jgi:hypothetical protein
MDQRPRFYPEDNCDRWLTIALMANLLLWVSMLYTVIRVNDYATERRMFIAKGLVILMIPLAIVVLFLISPYTTLLKYRRAAIGEDKLCKLFEPLCQQKDYELI